MAGRCHLFRAQQPRVFAAQARSTQARCRAAKGVWAARLPAGADPIYLQQNGRCLLALVPLCGAGPRATCGLVISAIPLAAPENSGNSLRIFNVIDTLIQDFSQLLLRLRTLRQGEE